MRIIKLKKPQGKRAATTLAARLGITPRSAETKEQLHRLKILRIQLAKAGIKVGARAKKAKPAAMAKTVQFPKAAAKEKKTKTVTGKKRKAA